MENSTYEFKINGIEYSLPSANVQSALTDIINFKNEDYRQTVSDLELIRDNWFELVSRKAGGQECDQGKLYSLQNTINLVRLLSEGVG